MIEINEQIGSKMKNPKVLRYPGGHGDADLVRIADSLPQIEDLHISHRYDYYGDEEGNNFVTTDEGIDYLTSKLKRLRKIDLVQESCISDKSLISLSKNCALLEHIEVKSGSVTEKGISFFINNSHNLNSFYLCAYFEFDGLFKVNGSTNFLANLRSLRLVMVYISDEFLISIAETRILLTDLTIDDCKGCMFTGISRLLHHSSQSLKSLELWKVEFLTNEHIEYLSSYIQNLTSIKLCKCFNLSDSAFVMITQRCTRLCHFEMNHSSLGGEEYNYDGLMKNCAIKYLDLSSNRKLIPIVLKKILNICPEVEKLMLRQCFSLPHDQLNVLDILKCNKSLVKLDLNGSCLVNDYGEDMESDFSMLEKVILRYSDINDKMLTKLGRICPRFSYLDLKETRNVTEAGVKEMVKSCKRPRYLSICCCKNMDINVIAWIVTNSSSLRKIVSPSYKYPDDENQKLFLQQGCLVLRDPHEPYDYDNFDFVSSIKR